MSYCRDTRFTLTAVTFLAIPWVIVAPATAQTLLTPWHDGIRVTAGSPGSYFGNPPYHSGNEHWAIDLNRTDGRDSGSEVLAALTGTVSSISHTACSGWGVRIRDASGSSLYLHLLTDPKLRPGIRVGQNVTAGQTIGILGHTGTECARGPHLHFVRYNAQGVSIPPYPFRPNQSITRNPTTLEGYHPPLTANSGLRWVPDGTLVKRANDSTLFLIQNGYRRGIPTLDVLESHRLNRYAALVVSDSLINAYPQGDVLRARPAIELKRAGGPAIYRITDTGCRQLFSDGAVFEGLGYSYDAVWNVSEGELARHPNCSWAPALYAPFPDGSLIESGGTVWVVTNGRRRGISSESVFSKLGYSWDMIFRVDPRTVQGIPEITPPITDATLGMGTSNPVPSPSPTPVSSCQAEGTLRSIEGRTLVNVVFANVSNQTRDIYWLDYSGRRNYWFRLSAGASVTQGSYATHAWLSATTNAQCTMTWVIQQNSSRVEIR